MTVGTIHRSTEHHLPTTRDTAIRLVMILMLATALLVAPGSLAPPAQAYPSTLNPTTGAYFGAFVKPAGSESNQGAVQQLEGRIGRKLKVDHQYYKWNAAIPTSQQAWDKQSGRIPFLNWNARKNDGSYVRWSAIAGGSQDAWIRERARAFRAFGSPLYLAFHHEPEDDVGSFGTASDFAGAFRRIVTLFREEGASNVAFVWTMMAWTFAPNSGRDPASYYPGDSYVDFVGSDGYNWYGCRSGEQWRSFSDVYANTRAFSLSRGKPWIAVEYGAQEDRSQSGRKAQWIRDVLPVARAWPDLAAILYFDSQRDGCDWSIDSSSAALSSFASIGKDAYLNGGGGTSPPPPPTPSPSPSPTPPPSGGTVALENSLDIGPDEVSITAGGSAGGGDPFSVVTVQGAGSLRYDNVHARGRFSARHTLSGGANAFYQWNGSYRSWYGRSYVYLDSLPQSALRLVRVSAGGSLRSALDILATGALRFVDRSGNAVVSTTATIATDRWVRIEWRIDHTTGRLEVRLFNDATSTTPSQSTSVSGASIGSSAGEIQIGRSGNQPFSITFWTDDPGISTTGFLGPA